MQVLLAQKFDYMCNVDCKAERLNIVNGCSSSKGEQPLQFST
jgi:hypothetical protein